MKDKSTDKKPQTENTRGKYNDKLAVKGSFLDIIQASVKDANSKAVYKKKNEPKP
jgi:hypothetical protein